MNVAISTSGGDDPAAQGVVKLSVNVCDRRSALRRPVRDRDRPTLTIRGGSRYVDAAGFSLRLRYQPRLGWNACPKHGGGGGGGGGGRGGEGGGSGLDKTSAGLRVDAVFDAAPV